MIQNTTIYFFSGTGNARHASQWLAESAESKGAAVSIKDLAKEPACQAREGEIIGICSPTHGFNFPPITLKFIFHFPRSRGNRAFLVNTRGGTKFGRLYFPGLSGIAQLFAALILIIKGYRIVGMLPLDMPSNWISLHPGLTLKASAEIIARCKKTCLRFGDKIYSGGRNYRALYDIIQDLLISPIAIGYYFSGRFLLAKSFYASKSCDNCGACIKGCPIGAISTVAGAPFWSYKCESCMKCMNNCPKRAIETAHGLVFAMIWIKSVYLTYLADKYLLHHELFKKYFILDWSVNFLLMFITVVLLYRIAHILLRFKFFRILIEWTSLTRFSWWNRFSKVKLSS